ELGGGIRRLQVLAVGHGRGGPALDRMRGAVRHAGGRGVDQLRHEVFAAAGQHVAGAHDVGAVVAVVAAPGTGLGGVVDDRVDAGAGGEHRLAVGEVAAQLAHADGV